MYLLISFIILLLIISIVLFLYKYKKNNDDSKLIEGLYTFNGRMAIDDQYYYDKVFDDVIYYPNEYTPDQDLVITGWIKCKQECPGYCVEYMVSGNSYCFPY
jgi:hypothetical protein